MRSQVLYRAAQVLQEQMTSAHDQRCTLHTRGPPVIAGWNLPSHNCLSIFDDRIFCGAPFWISVQVTTMRQIAVLHLFCVYTLEGLTI